MERDPLLVSTPPLGVQVTRPTDALGRPESTPSTAGGMDTQQLEPTPVGGVVIAAHPPSRRAGRRRGRWLEGRRRAGHRREGAGAGRWPDGCEPGGRRPPSVRPDAVRTGGRRRRGRLRWLKRTVLALFVLVVASAAWFGINLYQVHAVGNSDQARQVDAIVVMGAAQYNGRPSPQLAARLDHVVELWEAGEAPLVVVTGGKLPGDRFTEAEASSRYLVAHGVPAGAILEENQAHNSYDSLRGVHSLLAARNLTRVLLVSDPYHSLRIRLVSQELGLTAYVSPTRTSPVHGSKAFGKELEEAAGTSVGRIIGFRRLLSITG